MDELLRKMLVRLGLTYAGVSFGIYWVSEQMIASHVATMRNPSWRIMLPLRQLVFWSWRVLLYGLVAVLCVVFMAMVFGIMADVVDHYQNEKQAQKDKIIEEEQRQLREAEVCKRAALRKQKLLEESQIDSTPKPKPSIFSASTQISEPENRLSPEEVVRRTLESLKD